MTVAPQSQTVDFSHENAFSDVEALVEDIRAGKMVVLIDDESRENEGDVVVAAEHVSQENMTFMIKQASGQVCVAVTEQTAERLTLDLQPQRHLPENQARFLVSVEAAEGVDTGVSAADRVKTVKVLANPDSEAADLATPGHVFPLLAHQEGLMGRSGHTEGALALCQLADCFPAAVICEIIKDDGEMARVKDLQEFCKVHGLKLGRIDQIKSYIKAAE
ncbi:MAG: 3,4-dihydroxy-2-butanone-4-phosphate synthase [Alphaproteobacteria bacterium]|nr:3,4-dihydroxy-2-butanone-4-phosphate synthase [Alphaproteobacteria bacterium]